MRRRPRGFLSLCLLLLVAGCEPETKGVAARTQVMLRVHNSDALLLTGMQSLRAQLFMQKGSQWQKRSERTLAAATLRWPVDLPVLPPGEDEVGSFEVVVEALGNASQVLAQTRAVARFERKQHRLLELWLFACPGHALNAGFVCADDGCHGEDCEACTLDGLCEAVDVAMLTDFVEPGAEPAALTTLALSSGSLRPALHPRITDYTVDLPLGTETITLTPTTPEGARLEINGKVLEAGASFESQVLDLGPNLFSLEVSLAEHPSQTYSLTVMRGRQDAYLKASNTGTDDQFGLSVALSGDTLVVGAPQEDSMATGVNDDNQSDNTATYSGAAYVFVRDESGFRQQAYLKASDTRARDQFGTSVAVDGDTIVVGAPFEDSSATGVNDSVPSDNSATDSGAAYVFVRSGDTWTQQAHLKASNAESGDEFGTRVAIAAGTIVVGAPSEESAATGVDGDQADNRGKRSGAAYVFVDNGGAWTQQAYLKASNTERADSFASSLAISGDTIVVGACQEDSNAKGIDGDQDDNSASESGAAYVFVRRGSAWTQQAYLKASRAGTSDDFGFSVAIADDTIVVGASQEDSNATGINGNQADNSQVGSGAAYVFVRSDGEWTQQAYVKASNAGGSDDFGFSVAVFGDTLMVGAYGESTNAIGINGERIGSSVSQCGAAYVFARNGSRWSEQAYLKPSACASGLQFGDSVAVSGDTWVVGASGEDTNATGVNSSDEAVHSKGNSGAVYVFR